MKIQNVLSVNAIVWLGIGVAFTLFPYLILNLFGIPDIPENSEGGLALYNHILAFSRVYGSALITLGFLLYSVRNLATDDRLELETRRGILSALALGNTIAAAVAITEQFRIWFSPGGWLMILVPIVFAAIYIFLLATRLKATHD
jgi:hypothetical protein